MASVSSVAQHVGLVMAMAWKSAAVTAKVLPVFWAERIIFEVPLSSEDGAQKVCFDLAEAARLARIGCDEVFKVADGSDGAAILESMKGKNAGFLATDSDWRCEMVLMDAACGADSGLRLRDQILAKLPDKEYNPSVEECLQNLNTLATSESFRMASASAQALVNVTTKWLGRMADERPPTFADSIADGTLQPIIDRFQFFLKVEAAGGSAQAGTKSFGYDAFKVLWSKARAKHTSHGCDADDIKQLKVFSYLVPEDKQSELDSLVKDVEKGTNALADAAHKANRKKDTKSGDAAVAEAMALFR